MVHPWQQALCDLPVHPQKTESIADAQETFEWMNIHMFIPCKYPS